jgi:hypothetical protein
MTDEIRAAALDRMLARDAIREVLARYARAIDRADSALLKSCYFTDAIEEHGSSFTGRAHDYVDAAIPKVRTMGVMQHLLGNTYIELDGERAYVESENLRVSCPRKKDRRKITQDSPRIK